MQGAVLPAPDGGWAFRLDVVKERSGTSPDDVALLAGPTDDRPRAEPATMYPVSAFPMSAAAWRTHFGAAFTHLSEAKREHDPGQVLTPGYEIF